MATCWGWAEKGDIEVKFPEKQVPMPSPLSEAEKQRQDKEGSHSVLPARRVHTLPYHNMDVKDACRYLTLGQLIKLSDSVSVVKVVDVEDVGSESEPKRLASGLNKLMMGAEPNRQVPNLKVTISAETNLLDHLDLRGLSLTVYWWDRKRIPQKGDRWLACIMREDPSINMFGAMMWNFDKTKFRGAPKDSLLVTGQSRGAIDLFDSETERALLAAATGYLMNLRRQKWDAEKYYSLLRGLIHSPVPRIQDDAKIDLLDFLRTCPSFDLNRIIEDDTMDGGIKEYVRLILQPSRQSPKAP
jgi:hypothetical protein